MGCGASGGLLRYQMWSPSWISPKSRIRQEKEKIDFFLLNIKGFTSFCAHSVLFLPKKGKKHVFVKNGFTTCYL